jgi:hypothetical protein
VVLLLRELAAVLDESLQLEEANFIRFEPSTAQCWRINQQEKACHSEENGNNAFEQEDPAPALVPANAILSVHSQRMFHTPFIR